MTCVMRVMSAISADASRNVLKIIRDQPLIISKNLKKEKIIIRLGPQHSSISIK